MDATGLFDIEVLPMEGTFAPEMNNTAALDTTKSLGEQLAKLGAPSTSGLAAKVHRDVLTVLSQLPDGASCETALLGGLERLGHSCTIRVAVGGGACFRALRHQFLVVRGSGEFAGMELIVEPSLRQHFAIPHASPEYALVLSHAPDVFVGGSCRLVPIVQLLCALMAESFQRQGLALPPWRREQAMLSKWLPDPTRALEYTPTFDRGAATEQPSAWTPPPPEPDLPAAAASPWQSATASPVSELSLLLALPRAGPQHQGSAWLDPPPPRRRPDSDPSLAARGYAPPLLTSGAAVPKAAGGPPSPHCGISGASHSGALLLADDAGKPAAGCAAAGALASGRADLAGLHRLLLDEDEGDAFVDACPDPAAAAGGGTRAAAGTGRPSGRARRGTDTGMLPAARCAGAAPGLLSAMMVLAALPAGRAAPAAAGAGAAGGGGRLVTLPPAHPRAPAIHRVHLGWPAASEQPLLQRGGPRGGGTA